MPLSKYNKAFGGKKGAADEAMASMVKQYGPTKGKQVFYATKNKNMGGMASHGSMTMTKCDIGELRQEESVKAGGFKDGTEVMVAKLIPVKPFKKEK